MRKVEGVQRLAPYKNCELGERAALRKSQKLGMSLHHITLINTVCHENCKKFAE